MSSDSTSVQLFNALIAAARLRPGRRTLLMDTGGFPTNRYLTTSAARLLGLDVKEAPLEEFEATIRANAPDLAVVTASAVDYRTGELWDVGGLTRTAHEAGAVTVWDLSHAAGAVPLAVDQDEVDFAVGCSYKFLSGGPGAPSFAYVARRHHDHLDQPLTGWHGHAEPFTMAPDYVPAEGIRRYRISTPHVLSLLTLDTALDVFDKYDIERSAPRTARSATSSSPAPTRTWPTVASRWSPRATPTGVAARSRCTIRTRSDCWRSWRRARSSAICVHPACCASASTASTSHTRTF